MQCFLALGLNIVVAEFASRAAGRYVSVAELGGSDGPVGRAVAVFASVCCWQMLARNAELARGDLAVMAANAIVANRAVIEGGLPSGERCVAGLAISP